ncbi:hypothetical protein QBC46DRAFT_354389 [Diplogelasinospora grovesii]|uniref:Uncharacterized protein n=1 Tax=Diplogelasinospora grovesii TaxID=303347 RepID=A0AAN6N6I4_9PEZI|nr:hypothetical protein QBC46DRAFT_354389 [Diplogelasinospora grovesii]
MLTMARIPFTIFTLTLLTSVSVLAQNATGATGAEKLPGFGQPINILGAMERTDQDFSDGLALDLFSPTNRTLTVTQNTSPLPGSFVTGSNGEPFVSLSKYSWVIKMNETANDLIAKIEVPYDPAMLAKMGINEANTYVGKLADDRMSWVVTETTRNVHRSENNTRIIKMTSLDGEYMLLGRQTVDTSNIFVQYGQGETRTVNITGGAGRQEAEFIDGLRFAMVAGKTVRMNVDLKFYGNMQAMQGMVPAGMEPLNTYSWVVNTSDAAANMTTSMKVPFNRAMLVQKRPGGSSPSTMLVVAKRALNAKTTDKFQVMPMNTQAVNELPEDRITVRDVKQVDGEYILLITPPAGVANSPQTIQQSRGYKKRRDWH